ncbi:VWA domain-containing protein [Massilia sp. Root351]|uniref:vWA domain-containing protein n=1 Tax=Massilia sp. Root351 TaxID=1736522 RepID=UPI000AC36531|nr:VWA domain-containing protein [Massilia sp. Root351]
MQQPAAKQRMKDFAIAKPRPLPVIVLADASGSMSENGKIEALNHALADMVKTFASEARVRAEIQVGLITFGGRQAELYEPLTPAHQIQNLPAIQAAGATPLGQALALVTALLEDQERIPSRSYRPVLVLVSDGLPTDEWEPALAALEKSERASKATRMAMVIGDEADGQVLARFANDREAPVFRAHQARDIHRFFQAVTMSVATRTVSANPDQPTGLLLGEAPDDEALDLDF